MYGDIPYKFKYMLNKIINCILEYVVKNLNDKPLIESKFLLINNYILDIFHDPENKSNGFKYKKLQKISNAYGNKTIMPEFEKNVTLSKFNNIFLHIKQKEKNTIENHRKNSPYKDKDKDKDKIIKLKKLLKDEQEKSLIKELSYMKQLSFVKEKLNYYESKTNKINEYKKAKENEKNASCTFIKVKKKLIDKMKNYPIDKMNYLTMMNSSKNQKVNFFKNDFFPHTSRTIKHSLSQYKFNNNVKDNKKLNLKKTKSSKFFGNEENMIKLLKDKNNFVIF